MFYSYFKKIAVIEVSLLNCSLNSQLTNIENVFEIFT